MAQIAVVGSCMVDLTCFTPRFPRSGETIHGTSFNQDWGGKGANQCIAASRLGVEAALIACLGNDSFGREYKKCLDKSGINTKHVSHEPSADSGIAQITVAEDGQNQIIIVAGANNHLNKRKIDGAADVLLKAKVIIFQFETPLETTLYALKFCKGKNPKGTTIVNAAPAVEHHLDQEIYKFTDILCVNQGEAQLKTGLPTDTIAECEVALKKLLSFGCGMVIITLAKEGAVYASQLDEEVRHEIGAPVDKPVDTVGAGDVFIGSLAFLLVKKPHWSMGRKISVACQIAALSVMKKGTQASFPYAADLPKELLEDSDSVDTL